MASKKFFDKKLGSRTKSKEEVDVNEVLAQELHKPYLGSKNAEMISLFTKKRGLKYFYVS